MNHVFLSLGSNIHKERNLPAAVALLRERERVIAVSSVYESVPLGRSGQPTFFNAAVLLETALDPVRIKDGIIHDVEQRLQRQRSADKNAPRTIDIDITLFNDAVMDYVPADGRPRHIPDPDLLTALHVLLPVTEIAPDRRHPETGERLHEIAARLIRHASGQELPSVREDISLAG